MEKNGRIALVVSAMVVGMIGLSFAAVPMYRTFCQITGWGGTTQKAEQASASIVDREITIRFDGTISQNLPWSFSPDQVSQDLKVGETGLAFYSAENRSEQAIVGSATFNVQPAKAGRYFMKVECFCFTEQLLMPGQAMKMPVTYFVDPALADDRDLDEVREITLSYTFYRNEEAERRLTGRTSTASASGIQ